MSKRLQSAPTRSRRRSWSTLIAWGAAMVVLAVLGINVTGRLTPMSLEVPGSPSSRAEAMLRAKFGNTIPIAILLRGPAAQVNGQGRQLVARLRDLGGVQVLSPWDKSLTVSALRPRPGAAFVLVNYLRPTSQALAVVPSTERVLARTIRAPVHSYLTGVAVIGNAIQKATLADTERAEMIALPVLILVLLLVFRSPVAAAVPLLMGGMTVMAGHGLLWIATFLTPINSLGVAIAAMMSLALGVDYALLMVSRVRQELARGREHQRAVEIASRTAGRTIAAAGGTLALTMFAASMVATPGLLGPVAIGVVISGLLSVALALGAMPALLLLLGPRLNRWEVRLPSRRGKRANANANAGAGMGMGTGAGTGAGRGTNAGAGRGMGTGTDRGAGANAGARRGMGTGTGTGTDRDRGADGGRGGVGALAERLIAYPLITVPLILVGMTLLALPAGALSLGPPDASELPASDPAAQAVAMVQRTIGPGWSAPFVIVASADHGPITTDARLRALMRWQEAIAHEPDVAAVLGPGSVAGAQAKLAEAHAALASAPGRLDGAQQGVARLRTGLSRASNGVSELRNGLISAASGARRLGGGALEAHGGAQRLGSETGRARAGARRIASETRHARAGATRLAGATGRARAGTRRLGSETGRARDGARELQTGLTQAVTGSGELSQGIDETAAGAEQLADSDRSLTTGAAQLAEGMDTFDDTVHTALAPIELLAEDLQKWAGWIAGLRTLDVELRTHMSEAMHELEAMTVGRGDPRYAALTQDLIAAMRLIESNVFARLGGLEAQFSECLQQLESLPGELSQLTGDLDQLRAGSDRIATGTRESEEGAIRLDSALHKLAAGGHTLHGGLEKLSGGAGQLAGGLGKLEAGDTKLAGGLGKLEAGDTQLAGGLGKLANGDTQLAGGLGRLEAGDTQLAGGLGKLANGADRLAGGLSGGERRSGSLAAGLEQAQGPLRKYAGILNSYQQDYRSLHEQAPDALDSGYLVLTALDGTVAPLREQVAQLVNVDGGGQAMRMIVVAASSPRSPATAALSKRLLHSLPALASATGADVQIGQGDQYLLDYTSANTARVPWLILALAIVAALTLIVVLRALILPLIAVTLNLATIIVALGALELLTQAHLLGGPGYIDAASGAGIISIMFVLSIDYEVFLLTRMRERWLAKHDHRDAIQHGLQNTAGVITGSAAIMTAVFAAFAAAAVIPLRQFGVGLTIAVLLDATIVRLVLLPAIMRILGPRVWWFPAWLERALPNLEAHQSEGFGETWARGRGAGSHEVAEGRPVA